MEEVEDVEKSVNSHLAPNDRFEYLVGSVTKKYPSDYWINRVTPIWDSLFDERVAYSDAFSILDEQSWTYLLRKLLSKFRGPEGPRGKDDFFSTMNEALAYKFIVDRHLGSPFFVLEQPNERLPDISLDRGGCQLFCEVKTIGVSDDFLRINPERANAAEFMYRELDKAFFRRLKDRIADAQGDRRSTLLYFVVNFDDSTGVHLDNYRNELREHMAEYFPEVLYCFRNGVKGEEFLENIDVEYSPFAATT